MSTAVVPVSATPCPACGRLLAVDGDRCSCPRCGRAYTRVLSKAAAAGAYREAPVVNLVPVEEGKPVVGFRDVRSKGEPLAISVGSVFLSSRDLVVGSLYLAGAWTLFGQIVRLVSIVTDGTHRWDWLVLTLLTGLVLAIAADLIVGRVRRDQLSIEGDRLVWRRIRGLKPPRMKVLEKHSLELSRVTGVRDAGTHVRVELDDGTSWEVGKGLRIPRRARRWAAGRVAQSLPPPALERGGP